ncbi:GRAM domain-containing protein 4 [Thoreauomyces humboldtii]|nr:GRAM domain-containing protein 4 [Thoreauomyces humboldtii]
MSVLADLPPDGNLMHDLDTATSPMQIEDIIADVATPLVVDDMLRKEQVAKSDRNLDEWKQQLKHRKVPQPQHHRVAAAAAGIAPTITTSTHDGEPFRDAPPPVPHRPPSVASSIGSESVANGLQNVEVELEDRSPPPLPDRSQASRLSARSAEDLLRRNKDALKKLKQGVHDNIRKQVKSTKEFVALFTEPYMPPPSHTQHGSKSLSIGNLKEAGARFQDAVDPYVDCLEAVIRVSRWENPWRTGLLMVFYFWAWYATHLPYLVVAAPLFGLGATYAHSRNLFPGHGDVTKTTPENAQTPLGAATAFASAATESIGAAVKAPANAGKWWKAMGDLYGTGREGLGILEDASITLEKIKNLILWKVPSKTITAGAVYVGAITGLYLVPKPLLFHLVQLGFGWYFFVVLALKHHFPAYRDFKQRTDSLALFFKGVPSDGDLEREKAEREEKARRVQAVKDAVEAGEEPTAEDRSKLLNKIYQTSCIHTNPTSILQSLYGEMYLTPDYLVFLPKFQRDDLEIAWIDITDVRRVRVKSWVVGDGRGVRVTSHVNGMDAEYIFTTFPQRNEAYGRIMGHMHSLGITLPETEPYEHDDNDSDTTETSPHLLYPDRSDASTAASSTHSLSSLSDDDDDDDTSSVLSDTEPTSAPHIVVSDPKTHTSALGLPSYTSYCISVPALNTSTRRRYKEFARLKEVLGTKGVVERNSKGALVVGEVKGNGKESDVDVLLNLPPKKLFGRFSDSTIEKRRRALEKFLNTLAERGEVWGSEPWKRFLFN